MVFDMNRFFFFAVAVFVFAEFAGIVDGALAQGPPPARRHTVTTSSGTENPVAANQMSSVRGTITVEGDVRVIRGNGVPNHKVGGFPNRGNPHTISPQSKVYRVPVRPVIAETSTTLGHSNFGIGVNGVPFDPSAAEWYLGDRASAWQYEPLSGAIPWASMKTTPMSNPMAPTIITACRRACLPC